VGLGSGIRPVREGRAYPLERLAFHGRPQRLGLLGIELAAAAAVAGAAWLGARGGSPVAVRRSLAAGAVAGALVADAALQITCGAQDATAHLLTFHVGGVLIVAAAALLAWKVKPGSVRA